MVSQFTQHSKYASLGDLYKFPDTVYPVGRLDAKSEGLLILTDNPQLNKRLLNPEQKHKRTYHVEVEGEVSQSDIEKLENGVMLNFKGKKHFTEQAKALITEQPNSANSSSNSQPGTWIEITLTEGKNHQVRKMTAQIGHPTLQIIRTKIEAITLDHLKNENVRQISSKNLQHLLSLDRGK